MNKALLSSKKQDWRTPKEVLDVVRQMGPIEFDPCASKDKKHWFAKVNYTDYDQQSDLGKQPRGLSFANPPYGHSIPAWVGRLELMAPKFSDETIVLLPNRPGSRWYRTMWKRSDAYCFWNGRIKFVGALGSAPFPSVFFYKGPNKWKFCDVFSKHGDVGIP